APVGSSVTLRFSGYGDFEAVADWFVRLEECPHGICGANSNEVAASKFHLGTDDDAARPGERLESSGVRYYLAGDFTVPPQNLAGRETNSNLRVPPVAGRWRAGDQAGLNGNCAFHRRAGTLEPSQYAIAGLVDDMALMPPDRTGDQPTGANSLINRLSF